MSHPTARGAKINEKTKARMKKTTQMMMRVRSSSRWSVKDRLYPSDVESVVSGIIL